MNNNTAKLRFDRNELSGAFGDIGTDFPLITAMILAAGLHTPSVLIMFGAMQVLTGLVYRMPMPAQPLKAMATIVITQQVAGEVLTGAGLAIGVVMLLLSVTGLLKGISSIVPKVVVRGLQFGLGLSLCLMSLKTYIPSGGLSGYVLAAICLLMVVFLIGNKKYPASIAIIVLGVLYGIFFHFGELGGLANVSVALPSVGVPTIENIVTGFLLLSLPQIPLSIGNSIIATEQVAKDLFPNRNPPSATKLGYTYALMNLMSPFFGGIPTCHGSGGMVGHYTFGGRTGGSVVIYGTFYIVLGLFFSQSFGALIHIFPLPALGVILVVEGLALMALLRDQLDTSKSLFIALLTGVLAAGLPYGFVVAMLVGCVVYYVTSKYSIG